MDGVGLLETDGTVLGNVWMCVCARVLWGVTLDVEGPLYLSLLYYVEQKEKRIKA